MNSGLLLYIVTMSLVYAAAAAWLVHAIRNPRAAWDWMYGRHTQGGEPLPGALEKIQQQSAMGLILLPIVFIAGGFGANLKLQQLERKWEREKQQPVPMLQQLSGASQLPTQKASQRPKENAAVRHLETTQRLVDNMNEIGTLLATIEDDATADAALPRLEQAVARHNELKRTIQTYNLSVEDHMKLAQERPEEYANAYSDLTVSRATAQIHASAAQSKAPGKAADIGAAMNLLE